MTWSSVCPDGDPVRGDIEEFDIAVRHWASAKDHGYRLRDEFRSIVDGSSQVGLQGEAAEAFASIVEDAQKVLDDVPEVFGSLEVLLRDHVTKLRELKQAADAALARAKVAQAERESASKLQAGSNSRLATLQKQISQLRAQPPEQVGGQLVSLEQQLSSERTTNNNRRAALNHTQARIQTELGNWRSLRSQEDQLNSSTSAKLEKFDLKSLRDPGWLEKARNATTGFLGSLDDKIVGFFEELAHNFVGLIGAIASGDFDQALWHLRGLLDQAITVMSVVAVVAVAVVLAVGTIASGGTLLLAIGAVAAGLAVGKFATTALIVGRDAENKETGEKLGAVDVVIDGVSAVVALATLGKANALMAGAGNSRVVVFRHLAKEQSHIVMKNWGKISVKGTGREMAKAIGEEIKDRTIMNPDAWRNTFPMGETISGRGPTDVDSRRAAVEAEIEAIRRGDRGLAAPVQTVIVGTN